MSINYDDDLPQSEITYEAYNKFGPYSWMMRPCFWYREEYKDCKSIRGRVHQYFIYGETLDCDAWKTDFDNCIAFRKTQDMEKLENVIQSELKRKENRLQASKENDIWKYRSEPPKDWIRPLPDWFEQQNKNSYLKRSQTNKNNNNARDK